MEKRKSIHKMLAFLLSVTMLPVVFPLKNAQAAAGTLMTVDFEDYEVGVICEATELTNAMVGNIRYELYPGDKVEIAEENGNKFLKFTRGDLTNTNNSYVAYQFYQDDKTLSGGRISISYDYRPEGHNLYFSRFGTLASTANGFGASWASNKPVIQQIISYKTNLYVHNNTNNDYYVGGVNKHTNYDSNECAVITQTIDFNSSSNNYTFNAKYKNSSGSYTNIETITRTVSTEDIKAIAWSVKKHNTAANNGNYQQTDEFYNSSVYRIDNITVSVDGLDVADSNVENESEISANETVELTFDEAISDDFAQHISIYKDGVLSSNDNYTLNLSDDKTVLTVSDFEYGSEYSIKIAKTLKTQDETKAMINDYVLAFTTNSIISHNITRSKYEAGYTPEISLLDNINYTYSISKDGGVYEEYDLEALNEFGEYSLKIVATDEDGKEQIAIIEFQIVGAVAPEIKDAGINYSGKLDVGTELIGEYTYFDENDNADENKDYCTFQWYRSDKEASGYKPISGATGERYVLTEDDQNKYIRFGVKPFSKVAPTEGKEHLSEPFASFMTPEATNISISGKMAVGEELTVNYDYFDLNGDEEITSGTNATAVVWKISDTSDGEYTEVGSGKNYTLKDTDINKWLKVEVTPKNNGGGRKSGVFTSYIVKIIEASSGDLFTEDFESYDVGVIYEATDYIKASTGKIHYELYAGDKVEIAQADGNKYLKFTRVSEGSNSSYVMYEFPEAYDEGIISVSYDYKPEAHSQCFGRFGTLVSSANGVGKNWASDKPVIQQIISYAKNLYVHSGTSADYYVGGVNNLDNYVSNKCATVTQTIDFTKTSNNYTFNAKYKTSSDSYTNIGTITKTVNTADVNSIAWAVYKHGTASWNGPDSGASVYRIDNIKAIADGMSVEELLIADEDCVEITFDEALSDDASEHISVFKDGEELLNDAYTVSLSNDKKSVLIYGLDYSTAYSISISSDLEALSGKKLIGGFETEFKTESIINHSINREKYSMGYIPAVNLLRGIDYTMYISKDGAEYQEYNLEALEEKGKYKLKIVATDGDLKSQTMVVGFEIVEEIEPEISDIFIRETDTLDIGTVLQGEAVYFDINDEIPDANKDYCLFQWYRSESKDMGYKPIDGANAESYTLTADDEDKYIKLGVKPFSKVEPKEGEEYLSEPFVSFMNPTVTNVSITGKMATDEQLSVDYIYSDINGDVEITEGENATTIIWYTFESSEGQYTEVGRGRSYTIKKEDINKWFKVAVIPKNNGGGKQDKQFESKPVEGAFSPTVVDVKINGNLNVGSTIGVDYRFYDVNNDSESGSTIEWYVGDKLVCTDDHYTITSKDAGKSIYVSVTPKSSVEPAIGEAVRSESKTIKKKANTPTTGGGGGGGGGGSASKPTTNVPEDKAEGFSDISGHWAEASILKMVEKGIIYGKTDTLFAPEDKITRAEFATLISRMLNLSGSEYDFNDVDKQSWYAQSVSAVAQAGFMSGFNGNFRPMDNITREEMAVVISAIAAQKEIKYEEKDVVFADEESISGWAKEAVSAAAKLGIIQGMDDNKFVPKGDASRAQTVVMLARVQDILGQ